MFIKASFFILKNYLLELLIRFIKEHFDRSDFLTYFLTFMFCCVIVFAIYYKYDATVCSLKKQVILLSKQNRSLKSKMNIYMERIKNFQMKKLKLISSKGIITKETSLRISPISKSMPLNSLTENEVVKIFTCVKIADTTWYQVDIGATNDINSIGWVNENFISLVDDTFVDFDKNQQSENKAI